MLIKFTVFHCQVTTSHVLAYTCPVSQSWDSMATRAPYLPCLAASCFWSPGLRAMPGPHLCAEAEESTMGTTTSALRRSAFVATKSCPSLSASTLLMCPRSLTTVAGDLTNLDLMSTLFSVSNCVCVCALLCFYPKEAFHWLYSECVWHVGDGFIMVRNWA